MFTSGNRFGSWRRQITDLRRRFNGPERTAFVFSGGGNLGAVQVGMLRALAERQIVPDLIVGCSVGAINGAAFAAEPNLDGVERLDRIWRRIAAGDPDLMPTGFIPVVAQMARKGEAMHDQQQLAELLDDELQTKTFGGLTVPFSCVATDLESASEYWFDTGRLVPALLASAALPAVYPAFEHGGRRFIDGGVLNEIHTAQAVAMGATKLYVLHVGHLEDRSIEVQRPFDSAMRAYWTARRFRLEEDLRRVPEHCTVHRLPAGSNPRLRFDDFSQAAELADLAYDATAEFLRTGHTPDPVSGPVSDPADFEYQDQDPYQDQARDPALADAVDSEVGATTSASDEGLGHGDASQGGSGDDAAAPSDNGVGSQRGNSSLPSKDSGHRKDSGRSKDSGHRKDSVRGKDSAPPPGSDLSGRS